MMELPHIILAEWKILDIRFRDRWIGRGSPIVWRNNIHSF